MDPKMTLVAVKATGSVLAALSRVEAPDAEVSVEQAAGERLPARFDAVVLALPAATLAVATLPFDPAILVNPRSAFVIFPTASQPTAAPTLGSVNAGHAQIVLPMAATTLQVELVPAAGAAATTVPVATPFWVLFQGTAGEPTAIVRGEIAATKDTSDPVLHGLKSGSTYDALVLLTAYAPHYQQAQVP